MRQHAYNTRTSRSPKQPKSSYAILNHLHHKLFTLNDIWLISNHFRDSVSGPEKAGVGGSIPSLATNPFNNIETAKKRVIISRAYNTRTLVCLPFAFGVARSNKLTRFPRRVAGSTNVLERESGHNLPHIERLRRDIRCRVTLQQSFARFTSRRRVSMSSLSLKGKIFGPQVCEFEDCLTRGVPPTHESPLRVQ